MASLALPSFGRDELEVLSELMDEELFVDTDFGPASASLGDGVAEVAEMGWMRMDEAMPDASLFVDACKTARVPGTNPRPLSSPRPAARAARRALC